MKLKNKKTGAIYKIEDIDLGNNADGIWLGMTKYNSLAELNEEWEDYEEPKEGYIINQATHTIVHVCEQGKYRLYTDEDISHIKEIGMWFETKEEAEKAVEKLQAWKRLRDKGLEFTGWNCSMREITFDIPESFYDKEGLKGVAISDKTEADLDLLFGGEE